MAVALPWFEANHGDAWREQGYSGARVDGPSRIAVGRTRRWAALLRLRFVADERFHVRIGWAAERGGIESGG